MAFSKEIWLSRRLGLKALELIAAESARSLKSSLIRVLLY